MSAVPIPQRKPIQSQSDDSIFGLLGGIVDTAGELATDFFEFKLLSDQAQGQVSNPSVVDGANRVPTATGSVGGGLNNNQIVTYGAIGLAGVALVAALT